MGSGRPGEALTNADVELTQALFSPGLARKFYKKSFLSHTEIAHALVYCSKPSWALVLLERTGMLPEIFPELERCRNVAQNDYHHLPVLEHTFLVCGHVEAIAPSLWPIDEVH